MTLKRDTLYSLVDEGLESCPALLDEALLVNAVVRSKGHLSFDCLRRQRGHYNLQKIPPCLGFEEKSERRIMHLTLCTGRHSTLIPIFC